MSRGGTRRWRPPKQGWDDDFAGVEAAKAVTTRRRAPVDEELLSLQAAWTPGVPKVRKPQSSSGMALALADPTLVHGTDRHRSAVRSGGLNYDAQLMLRGIETYDRLRTRTRRPRGEEVALEDGDEDDVAAAFTYFESKWEFIYAFVDREKDREAREAEARRKRRATEAAHEAFFGVPFASAPGEAARQAEADRRRAEEERRERRAVEDLPAFPRLGSAAPPNRVAKTSWSALEAKLHAGATLAFDDIPWPAPCERLVDPRASPASRKRDWRAALRRWHPDKFSRILERAAPTERSRILERCKQVTRQIIAEKSHMQ